MDRRYYSFDVDGFFRDYNDNKRKQKFLREKYASAIISSGGNPDEPKVAGGLPTSQVEAIAEKREKISKELKKYDKYFEMVDGILNALEGEERFIAEEYFLRGKKRRDQIEILAEKTYCSTATCYRKIREVRQKIKEIVRNMGA